MLFFAYVSLLFNLSFIACILFLRAEIALWKGLI